MAIFNIRRPQYSNLEALGGYVFLNFKTYRFAYGANHVAVGVLLLHLRFSLSLS